MRLVEKRGGLAGALVCSADDEIFAIASNGVVIRTRVDEIRAAGRDTMGVSFMKVGEDDEVVAVARADASAEAALEGLELDDVEITDEAVTETEVTALQVEEQTTETESAEQE
jgi:DNA gyrase subunit A